MTTELALGVNGDTLGVVEPDDELPVDPSWPVVKRPESSLIETLPVTAALKVAAIVSAPELPAVPYQM